MTTSHSGKSQRQAMLALLCVATIQVVPGEADAADLAVYGTLTSEYIYRGLSMSDRNPALQAGLDISFNDHLFAGAWVSTIDLRNPNGGRDVESNLYAGLHYALTDRLSATATLLRYAYPGADGIHKYEHNEGLLSLSWDARYSLEYAYTDDARGLGRRATHVMLSADWPLRNGWILGANAGRYDLSRMGLPAYIHGNVGLSTRVSRLTFDARLYGHEPIDHARLDNQAAGTRFVVSVSAAF